MEIQEYIDTYAYVLVRIAAAKAKAVTLDDMNNLIGCSSIESFKQALAEIDEDITIDILNSSKDLEKTLHQVFFKYAAIIIKNSPRECQEFMVKYMQKYEVENLKDIVVAKLVSLDSQSIREGIYYQVEDMLKTTRNLENALNAENLDELIYWYRKTPYHGILHEIQDRYNKTHEIFFVYAFLDKFYIDDFNLLLDQHSRWNRGAGKIIKFFVGKFTDFYNLSTTIRAIDYNFTWDELELLLSIHENERLVSKQSIKELFSIGPNMHGLTRKLKEIVKAYQLGQNLTGIISEDRLIHSLKNFYFCLYRAFTHSLKFKQDHELCDVIMFIIKKEIEIDNLVTIFEGIKNNYERKKLKKYIIQEI